MRLTPILLGVFAAVRKLVAWMLVPGVLSLGAIALARAQDRGATPDAAARAANAPPLVPVRLHLAPASPRKRCAQSTRQLDSV